MESARSSVVQKSSDQRSSISCNTMCSSNSSCILKRRKPINPLATPLRSTLKNPIKQRVLSAKLLKFKTLQNQLNDAHYHITELMRENQTLKTLQKRQDKALSRYEGTSAELPRMLQAYEEEIRVLNEKNKNLRRNIKELNDQFRHKDDELQHLQEQIKKYEKLNKDKHLLEREKLTEMVEDLQEKLQKADTEIVTLNRKLTLESKNFKFKLNQESNKLKQSQKELNNALNELEKLTKQLENSDRLRFVRKRNVDRKATSLISLNGAKPFSEIPENDSTTASTSADLKLEPLERHSFNKTPPTKETNGILKSPSENIKARLSMESAKSHDWDDLSHNFDKVSLSESDTGGSGSADGRSSRSNSSHRLDQIARQLDNAKRRGADNNNIDEHSIDKRLGDYCSHMVDTVRTCTTTITHHKQELRAAKNATNKIIEQLKEAENKELNLKHSQLLSMVPSSTDQTNIDLVSQMLSDELEFQRHNRNNNEESHGNHHHSHSNVELENKKRLLATLKAIDNGDDSIEFDNGEMKTSSKGKLMRELFGDLAN